MQAAYDIASIGRKPKQTFTNPFPGLRPFRTDETHLFFGREGQVDEVLEKLEVNRFTAVLGTSGSGKSSLMYCGLIPSLHGGFMTRAGSDWRVVVARPGVAPINNLADAIAESDPHYKLLDEEEQLVRSRFSQAALRSSSLGLVELVKQAQREKGENFLILVDQFEELFRFNRVEDESYSINESSAFVKLLMEAVRQSEVPVYIVMTMRSDYIGDCAQFPQLTGLINDSHYLIPLMTREQKRDAILGPIAVGGAKVAPRLVQQLLNDLGDSTDQLPILQHALMRTWDFWAKNKKGKEDKIDTFHYESIGRMAEALSMHANEAYDELDERGQEICEVLFKALTEKTDDGRGVRRPTKLHEIAEIAKVDDSEVIEVVERFRMQGRTFLMPPPNKALTTDSVVDISHESLMRIWVRCRDWVEEEYEAAKIYRRLSEAAAMYQIGKTSLWRPPDLQLATNWQDKQEPNLVWAQRYDPAYERAMVFLTTSQQTYEEEQRSRDRIQKRHARIMRIVNIVIGAACIVMIILLLYADIQKDRAESSAQAAKSSAQLADEQKEKAVASAKQAEIQRQRAEDNAEEARLRTLEAEAAAADAKRERQNALRALGLAEAAQAEAKAEAKKAREAQGIAEDERQRAEAASKLADENAEKAARQAAETERLSYLFIAQAMAVKSQQIRDTTQKALVAKQAYNFNAEYGGNRYNNDIYQGLYQAEKALEGAGFNLLEGHTDAVRAMVFAPDGKTMYSAGSDGKILKWLVGQEQPTAQVFATTENVLYRNLVTSPNGKWMAAGTFESGIELYNLEEGQKVTTLERGQSNIWSTAFMPDGNSLITTNNDGELVVWNLEDLTHTVVDQLRSDIKSIALSEDGIYLAGVMANGQSLVWDTSNNFERTLIHQEPRDVGTAVAISPEHKLLIKGYRSGKVLVWDLEKNTVVNTLEGHNAAISQITFSKGGEFMATASLDGTAHVWQLEDLNEQPIELRDHDNWVVSVAFSPDAQNVYTGTSGQSIKVYPLNVEAMASRICNNPNLSRTSFKPEEWEKFVGKDLELQETCK